MPLNGFDVVIGNPPYLDYRDMPTKQAEILKIYKTNEQSARPNLYQYFIEQAYNIVKHKGQVCYINPAQFLSIDAGFGIRKLIVEQAIISFIDDISNMKIFDEASTYTIIWAFRKEKNGNYPVRISKCLNANDIGKTTLSVRKNDIINNGKYLIIANINKLLIQKIEREKTRLKDIAKLTWGTSQSGYGKKKINSTDFKLLPLPQQSEYAPIIQTRDIKRLFLDWKGEYIPRSIFSDAVILKFKQPEKIVIARMTLYLQAALDRNQYFVGKSTVLNIIDRNYQTKYLLALLNSKLINFWYSNYFENTHLSGGYIRFDIPYLEQIPIAYCRDQQHYVDIVDAIIAAKQQDINADISIFQQKLDILVYQLYELTADEIKVVEGAK
jgi:adenine-specific DNA-methyltransferase